MRILIWADAFWPGIGGLEVFSANLVRALKKRGHVCEVITNSDFVAGHQIGDFEGTRVHAFAFLPTLQHGRLKSLARQHRACSRIVEDFRPDVIHLHGMSRSMLPFILQQKRRRRPALVTLHDNLTYRGPLHMAGSVLGRVDTIAAVSEYMRKEALDFDPRLEKRLVTVRNALPEPASAFTPPPAPRHILMPGRMVKDKGIDLAIQAFLQVASRFPDAVLTIAGDGEERTHLEALARDSEFAPRISFLGVVPPEKMPQLIANHALVLMPSRWQEPFGLVALEASQMGRPVIASRVGGIPEIIEDGVTGLLFEKGDVAGLTQALHSLLEDSAKCARMGRAAQAHVSSDFRFEKLLSHYEELYRSIAVPDSVAPGKDPAPPVPPIRLLWEAAPFAHHSFGVVSRETGRALLSRPEIDFTFIPYEKDHFDPLAFPEYAPLAAACARHRPMSTGGRPAAKPVLVRLQFPLRSFPPPGVNWVVYHPWEFTRSARASVEIMNRAREVWTTSQFAKDAFVRSGVPAGKIHVIPNGVDLDIFRVAGPTAVLPTTRPFRFLFVGGTIFRKGVDILLQAYGQAFTAADPVSLVIKDYGGNMIYPYEKGAALIAEFLRDSSRPEVIHLPQHRSDAEMAELYRACDVFVSSYRGEGFCLPALEAMACGKPVIVTQGGSTDDFVPESAGWKIPAKLQSTGREVFGMPVDGEVELFEPDVDALAGLLRRAFHENADRAARGSAALQAAQDWSWDAAAEKIVERCRQLTGEN